VGEVPEGRPILDLNLKEFTILTSRSQKNSFLHHFRVFRVNEYDEQQ